MTNLASDLEVPTSPVTLISGPAVIMPHWLYERMVDVIRRLASDHTYRVTADGEELDEFSAMNDEAQAICGILDLDYEELHDEDIEDDEEADEDD